MTNIEKYFNAFKINSRNITITKEELKRRYRILLKKYHPDIGGSVTKTQLINEAYRHILGIVEKYEEEIKERRKRKIESLNKKYWFYADGSIFDRRKKRLVKWKGRKINVKT